MIGSDADIVIFNPDKITKVDDKKSIYDRQILEGCISAVFALGKMIVNDNKFLGKPCNGSYLARRIKA